MAQHHYHYETTWPGIGSEFEVKLAYSYYPGRSAYWDRSLGGWLPGDDPEIEFVDVEVQHPVNGTWVAPDKAMKEAILDWANADDRAREMAHDEAREERAAEMDDSDRRYDEARDRKMEEER
jgi:hypothetical protein